MEHIIHYRHQSERFYNKVLTYNLDYHYEQLKKEPNPEPTSWDDFLEDTHNWTLKKATSETNKEVLSITNEEFKAVMSDNGYAMMQRETIVVSEDTDKNTVSFKKYYFGKGLVQVEGLKRKKFKIDRKIMYSVTINKVTGDFSVYRRVRGAKGGSTTFVRKNISNGRVRTIIQSMIVNGFCHEETNEGMRTFLRVLGYPEILDYEAFMYAHFGKKCDPIPGGQHVFAIFPFLNFLRKRNIQILGQNELYTFELLFRRNKKKYYGKQSTDVYKDYYGLSDIEVAEKLRQQINEETPKHILRYKARPQKEQGPGNPYKPLMPNYYALALCEFHNISASNAYLLPLVNKEFVVIPRKLPAYIYKVLDLYNFENTLLTVEMSENRHDFEETIIQLNYFRMFGIKLKIKSMQDYHNRWDDFAMLFDILCQVRSQSGTVTIPDEWYNYFMDQFAGHADELIFHTECKVPRRRAEIRFHQIPPLIANADEQKKSSEYEMKFQWRHSSPIMTVRKGNSLQRVYLNFERMLPFETNIDHQEIPIGAMTMMPFNFFDRRNGTDTFDNFEFTQIYSKELLQKKCDELGLNLASMVEFIK